VGRSCQETAASSTGLSPISRLTFMWPPGAGGVACVGCNHRRTSGFGASRLSTCSRAGGGSEVTWGPEGGPGVPSARTSGELGIGWVQMIRLSVDTSEST
jgi:hypothetical protein